MLGASIRQKNDGNENIPKKRLPRMTKMDWAKRLQKMINCNKIQKTELQKKWSTSSIKNMGF